MDLWTLLPVFITYLTIAIVIRMYKYRKNREETTSSDKSKIFSPYIELFFLKKTQYKSSSTNAFFTLSMVSLFLFIISISLYFLTPAIAIEELETAKGKIISIVAVRKGPSKLKFLKNDGTFIELSTYMSKLEVDNVLNDNVQVWYGSTFNIKNELLQIYMNEEPIQYINGVLTIYDYEFQKKKQGVFFWIFIGSFISWIVFSYVLWTFNKRKMIKLNKKGK